MNKKKSLMITLAITTALAVPFSAFAAKSDSPTAQSIRGFFGIDSTKLSDTQKADVDQYVQKAAQLQKDFISKMVENGTITKEQGDAEIKKIDDRLASGEQNGFLPGFGFGKGPRDGKMGYDMKGFAQKGMDLSKLTDDQKAQLTGIYNQMAQLQKDHIGRMVESGLITKEQGDACTAKIDALMNASQKAGATGGLKMFNAFGGFNLFDIKGIDSSKLTDAQKTEMKDTAGKMTDYQKQIIDKLVSFGIMTQEQGDVAKSRLDTMSQMGTPDKFQGGKGDKFQGEKGRPDMMKGRQDGRRGGMDSGKQGAAPNTNSTAPNAVTPTAKS